MIAHVYKPKRRKNGKLVVQRNYRGRYRINGEFGITEIPLHTADKQVAHNRLMEMIRGIEQERAGLKMPKAQREALNTPLPSHLQEFLADLETMGRSRQYRTHLGGRVTRLLNECGFRKIGDVVSESFLSWRNRQSDLGAKTLNDYLDAMNVFLNWLKRKKFILHNPLESVEKVDMRGRQMKRRAFTREEFQRLLEVSGEWRLLYLTAQITGLRQNELRGLLWIDLHLEAEKPFLVTWPTTTKNKKEAIIPLHPALAKELRSLKAEVQPKDDARVFRIVSKFSRVFKRDLGKAGIESFDARGRKIDFHSLRHTFATRLAENGTAPRLTQELMRHSDVNLAAKVYTDVSQLPIFEVIHSLRWEGDPQIDPQNSGSEGQIMAGTGTRNSDRDTSKTLANKASSHVLTPSDANRQMVEPRGIEPRKH